MFRQGTREKDFTMRILAAAALAGALLPIGCATYVKDLCHGISPSSTFVRIESNPPGATAKFSDGRTVITPTRVVLRSDRGVTVSFTKDGYKPAHVEIGPGFNYWFLGDLLAFPPIGFLVDAEQGAVSRSYPSSVNVELESLALQGKPASTPESSRQND